MRDVMFGTTTKTPLNDTCPDFDPTAGELFETIGDHPGVISILVVCTIITIIECILFCEAAHYVASTIPYTDRRNCIIWILGIYPVFCLTSLLGLYIPRSAVLCNLTASVYFSVCLYQFFVLIIDYYGGHDSILLQMSNIEVSLRSPPIGCFFPCLPTFKMTEKNLLRIKIAVFQCALIRPFVLFVTEVLWLNGTYVPGSLASDEAFLYVNIITLTSTIIAIYAFIMFYRASREPLHGFKLTPKFIVVQLALICSNIQIIFLGILVLTDVIPCDDPFPTDSRHNRWQCLILTLESAIIFPFVLKFFRTRNGNIVSILGNGRVKEIKEGASLLRKSYSSSSISGNTYVTL
ncbi:organic solute transporter subunit alpha-like [Anneissia japonica]|uniref:organic solute transporter subunit alpha-like n=1 Tax=Anneissia japonica TaxID=1529436 RepID=UPI001425963D|nr:organic solute transporter subunit alpha-like [Anneissia japonica]XP_033125805.1 organic solute transporter subunit alpha-like [Anneissia japonica]